MIKYLIGLIVLLTFSTQAHAGCPGSITSDSGVLSLGECDLSCSTGNCTHTALSIYTCETADYTCPYKEVIPRSGFSFGYGCSGPRMTLRNYSNKRSPGTTIEKAQFTCEKTGGSQELVIPVKSTYEYDTKRSNTNNDQLGNGQYVLDRPNDNTSSIKNLILGPDIQGNIPPCNGKKKDRYDLKWQYVNNNTMGLSMPAST